MLLVVAATETELRAALAPLASLAPLPDMPQGRVLAVECGGPMIGRPLLALVTGVGVVNAGLALGQTLGQAVAHGEISGVVNLGLAGSFDLDHSPLGSVCVATRETWPEYGLGLEPGRVDAQALKFPLARVAGPGGPSVNEIWNSLDLAPDKAAAAMGLQLDAAWPRAESLTVSTVSGTAQRADGLRSAYVAAHKPGLENMEGFALAYGCALAGIPFLEVRAVSNLVGSRSKEDWSLKRGLDGLARAAQTLLC